jgi:hypothetical protein
MPADGTHRHDEFHRGLVPQAQLGTGSTGAGTKVLYDDQTYKTPSGGGGGSLTVELLNASGSVTSVTTVRVAKVTNNGGGDVSLLPQITGGGTGNADFGTHYAGLTSPDGRTFVTAGDVPGAGAGSTGAYIGSEHTPANIANKGINLQAGNDYLGLYISAKDGSTLQIYPDIADNHAIQLVDLGDDGHWQHVSDEGGIAEPGMGMLPRYSSAPHSGVEVEGEAYYDLTTHKSYTWDGSTWQAHW